MHTPPDKPLQDALGDTPAGDFRAAMHQVADMVADYLEHVGARPVVPAARPGDVAARLDATPPLEPQSLDAILNDYRAVIEPNTTHWNHPGFLAYFAITGSGPGILAEALAAGLNVNAMLWRTGPAATELEERVCDWLRQMMQLPPEFRGHINDTASIASMLGLAAARHRADASIRQHGAAGRAGLPAMTVYCSEHAHSSIDKAVVALGLGLDNLRRLPTNERFELEAATVAKIIAADRANGRLPIALVATAGTTSTTSIDPLRPLGELARRERVWFHVDAAYGGSAAICPELRPLFDGIEVADSIVTNPHKWLFTPVDCSVLFVRDAAAFKETFSIVPEYLRTPDSGVTNLMDYGVQLGRRFRSLKLWMVIRAFGVRGLQERIRHHCALAREFADWLREDPGFEIVAPVPLSTVCFRARFGGGRDHDAATDAMNERLLADVNAAGPVYLSHTKLNGRFVIRLTIGNIRTSRETIETAWKLLRDNFVRLRREDSTSGG